MRQPLARLLLVFVLVFGVLSGIADAAPRGKATATAPPDTGATAAPATPAPPAPKGPLKVYTKPIEPFAYQVDGKAVGFGIDLWDRIAKEAGLTYELVWVQSVGELIEGLQKREGDLAVAAISITAERERLVDFSQPFYESGLGILVSTAGTSSVGAIAKSFFSPDFLKLFAVLILLLIVTAHLVWVFERKRNPDRFPDGYLTGVWESAWWGISTILSGGCDNKGPIVLGGRIVGAFWMLTSIILTAYFTASITTIMTVTQLSTDINGPNDLPGKKVATVKGSTAESYLLGHRAVVKTYPTIDDAYAALGKKDVVAVVYDAPILLYHAAKDSNGQTKVVGRLFQKQNYGIALQEGSKHRKEINAALLKLREGGFLDELNIRWFGTQE